MTLKLVPERPYSESQELDIGKKRLCGKKLLSHLTPASQSKRIGHELR